MIGHIDSWAFRSQRQAEPQNTFAMGCSDACLSLSTESDGLGLISLGQFLKVYSNGLTLSQKHLDQSSSFAIRSMCHQGSQAKKGCGHCKALARTPTPRLPKKQQKDAWETRKQGKKVVCRFLGAPLKEVFQLERHHCMYGYHFKILCRKQNWIHK